MMKRSPVLRQLSDTLTWNVVSLALGLVAGILTARLLLPQGKGVLSLVLSSISLVGLVSALGTNVSVRVFLPRGSVSMGAFWFVSCLLTVVAAFASLPIVLGVGFFVDATMLEWKKITVCIWLGAVMFLGNQLLDAFNALGRTAYSAFLNALVLVLVVLSLLVQQLESVTLLGVLTIYAISYSIRVVVALWSLRRDQLFRWVGVRGEGCLLVTKGVPLLGLNVGQALTYRLDQLVLGAFRGAHDVGLYAVAATPASAGQVISNSVGQIVFRRVSTGEYGKVQTLRWATVVLLTTGIFAGALYVIAPWMVPFFFGPQYADSVALLRLLVVAEVCLAPYMVLSRAAAGAKMISVAAWSGIVGLSSMLVLLLILIPLWGLTGAALACIVSYSLMTLYVLLSIIFGRWDTSNTVAQ